VVADELAAAVGEACAVLLAVAGGESPHAAAVWPDAAADGCPVPAEWVARRLRLRNLRSRRKGRSGV